MTVGTSAVLLPIAHDWFAGVTIESVVPSVVLPHDDGSGQRLALATTPTERVTYRILAPSNREAASLLALVDQATDAIVRVPRWEDQARLTSAVSAGALVSIPCDTTNKPTFVVNRQVILWRSATSYEVTTAQILTSGSITADLASSWAEGTIIAPVMPGRLVLPLAESHWVPTSGALEFAIDFDVTDIAGIGAGGTATTGTATAISVGNTSVGKYGRSAIVATITDAVGNVLPGTGVVWSSADPSNAPVSGTSDPAVAMVSNPNGIGGVGLGITVSITATKGALSASGTATLRG